MHAYRSHTCADLSKENVGDKVRLSGWVHRVRDHGGILFIDLRDHYGMTQVLCDPDSPVFAEVEKVRSEWCIRIDGEVKARDADLVNTKIPTGEIEVFVRDIEVLGPAKELPLQVFGDQEYPEETRLRYRYLDLRRAHVNARFQMRSKVLQYGRDHLITEGFAEINSPKIIAAAAEGGTNLFPMMYFDTPAFLSQSPQLYKQLAILGGLERVFEIGPAFRAEKHDTYRHLNEFISFDIEGAWMNDEDVMCVQERMIHHIWTQVAANDQNLIDVINEYKTSQGEDTISVDIPQLPFPRISYCEAIEIVQNGGGEIEWGDDIESHHCDIIAAEYPGFHFLPRWPMAMKPFYIYHNEDEKGATGGQLSRGFDLNYGRDEMTSGGQREHRVDVLEQNLRNMNLDPKDFTFYTDGFRYGAPPHAGWGLGVARLLMVLTGAGNVREVVLFPRDRSRVTP